MTRPGMTREKILERVAGQMNEEEKMKLCDHVVQNDGVEALIPQIVSIHKQLMARVK